MQLAPAPLFRDPIYDGAADPVIIWNRQERAWWLLYTNRRANVPCQGVAWVHGTDIGIASSADAGRTWTYRGILEGLTYGQGRNTFWAPEIFWHDGLYHAFVSYVPGIPHDWNAPRSILHYTSADLWRWQFDRKLTLSSEKVIDACVFPLPAGGWRMWYKDEAHDSHTFAADSPDLSEWTVRGEAIADCPHEGPNVFRWKGAYWMIVDTWSGQGVYRSDDLERWTRQGTILSESGQRNDDGGNGLHADVLVNGDRAFVFYFTHPDRTRGETFGFNDTHPYSAKRTSLQVAELEYKNALLCCDRDNTFDFTLLPPELQV